MSSSRFVEKLKKSLLTFDLYSQNDHQVVIRICINAKPASKKDLVEIKNEKIIVWTRAQPVAGAANLELRELLAEFFCVPKSAIEIEKGDKSKEKKFLVLFDLSKKNDEDYLQNLSTIC